MISPEDLVGRRGARRAMRFLTVAAAAARLGGRVR
jgi:hypothetical protein